MAKAPTPISCGVHGKKLIDIFQKLCYSRSSWQVWADFIISSACALNAPIECLNERNKEFQQCLDRLGDIKLLDEMFQELVAALDENPEQDFLGEMFMALGLGNHWKGQFFTPYSVCRLMSEMTIAKAVSKIKEKGWASINDPACGAGATLIAAANILKARGVNYQLNALFVAQDIDRIAALMCYIQLSLLGCAGYVVVGDSLRHPCTGPVLFPHKAEELDIWYTPMFAHEVWNWRRVWNAIDWKQQGKHDGKLLGKKTEGKQSEPEQLDGQMTLFDCNFKEEIQK